MRTITVELKPGFLRGDEPSQTRVIRLSVGLDLAFDMLPYPTARRSAVNRDVFQDALAKLGEDARRGSGLLLGDLLITGQAVPDLLVRPSVAPSRLHVDGFLGLDFFEQFDLVEWRPKAQLVRLITE